MVTPGAKQAMLYSFLITTMPGDEVILLAPSWASYEPMLEFIGAIPVHVPVREDNFHPDLDAVKDAITERTKMILINSPTVIQPGSIHPEIQILDIATDNDLWIVSDEIYSQMIWVDYVSMFLFFSSRWN